LPADSGRLETSDFIGGEAVYVPLDEDHAVQVSDVQIENFVAALARALHAFVTYPRRSPARDDVVLSVQKALQECETRDLILQVTNEGLRFDGRNLDVSGNVARGLVLLMRRAFVAAIGINNTASTRDIGQFCELLADPETLLAHTEEFAEILKNRGVKTIQVHVISSHQTIEAGAISSDRLTLVEESRKRNQSDSSTNDAAEGGWVRVDPSVSLGRIALSELPLVLPDAARVAVALRQLNGRRRESMSPDQALVSHFQHVAALYESAEPGLTEALFTTLADAVSNLPEQLKTSLFQNELLPALVDGSKMSRVLTYLPDAELACALPGLMELGIGGVEMLSVGLSNLNLSQGRKAEVLTLLADRSESGATDETMEDEGGDEAPGRTEGLLTLDGDGGHEFAPLAGFDLSVDDKAATHLMDLVREVDATDMDGASLRCYTDLVGLVADPSIVTSILRRSRALFIDLESRGCLFSLADAVDQFATIANGAEGTTDEVAFMIHRFLAERITPEFVRSHAIKKDPDANRALAQILASLEDEGADLVVAALQSESDRSVRRQLLKATRECVGPIAPGLVTHLGNPNWHVVRNVLSMLGHAGPGYESSIASCFEHENPKVLREAFMALAKIGSSGALTLTMRSLDHESWNVRQRAADTIWRFPSAMSHSAVRDVLTNREWLLANPEIGRRLIRAGERRHLNGLPELVRDLRPLRFAIWDRGRMALGREAWKVGRQDD